MTKPRQHLTGERYGRLVVTGRAPSIPQPGRADRPCWFCECDCSPGTPKSIRQDSLKSGLTQSCGCLQRERVSRPNGGLTGTPEYGVWMGMRNRCKNKSNGSYHNYGGRGIRVCAGWTASFTAFLTAVGPRPQGMWIDRMDNDGHYSCGHCDECRANDWAMNCRWATVKDQLANRRSYKRTGGPYDRTAPDGNTTAYIALLRSDPCSYCGVHGHSIDHITPVSLSGTRDWTNITAACRSCNSRKHTTPLLHYLLKAERAPKGAR